MLETTWFILWGVLWAVYFMLDGFDLGIGSLFYALGKNETEKRMLYNAMGPFWDGNEVWLIAAGGITFAAFPKTYAILFSSQYSALMLILFALILRGVSLGFRGELENQTWINIWDFCLFIGSALPAILFGVAFSNIFKGIPLDRNDVYLGNFFTLLNPYGLLGGIFFFLIFAVHGAIWVSIKTEGELQIRAEKIAKCLWIPMAIVAAAFLAMSAYSTGLYKNYVDIPVLFIIPSIAVTSLIFLRVMLNSKYYWRAWFSSGAFIFATTMFGIVGLFPNMLPSSIHPDYSVTIYTAASSAKTLKIMLAVVAIFLPIVIGYQIAVYNLFKNKITAKELEGHGY